MVSDNDFVGGEAVRSAVAERDSVSVVDRVKLSSVSVTRRVRGAVNDGVAKVTLLLFAPESVTVCVGEMLRVDEGDRE